VEMLEQAIALAVKLHHGQARDGDVQGHCLPYIVHPVEVMKTVWAWGAGDEVTLTAAVLHDTLEQTSVTDRKLRELFDADVLKIVKELTFSPTTGLSKEDYLGQFATASIPALVIKLADRYCNVLDFMLTKPEYASRYFHKAAPLIDAARSRLAEINERFGGRGGHDPA
jgi:(p)ppGpp synthase/HD superfamily hydrolase